MNGNSSVHKDLFESKSKTKSELEYYYYIETAYVCTKNRN